MSTHTTDRTIIANPGALVRAARDQAGLSQSELGARLGKSRQFISQLEAGTYNPTVQTLQKVADALEIELVLGFKAPKGAKGKK